MPFITNFDRDGDLLLHFFGGAARPLRDDLDIVIGHVGIGFDGQVVERDRLPKSTAGRPMARTIKRLSRAKSTIARIIKESL